MFFNIVLTFIKNCSGAQLYLQVMSIALEYLTIKKQNNKIYLLDNLNPKAPKAMLSNHVMIHSDYSGSTI